MVRTDHKPLLGLTLDEKCNLPKRMRLLEELQQYNIKWEYLRGERNYMADWLSRDGLVAAPVPIATLEIGG